MSAEPETGDERFERAERWLWRIVAAAIAALGIALLTLPVPTPV